MPNHFKRTSHLQRTPASRLTYISNRLLRTIRKRLSHGQLQFILHQYIPQYISRSSRFSTKCFTVKPELQSIFATLSIPKELVSYNGPPLNSQELRDFATEFNFRHRRVTPYWPETNGVAESFLMIIGNVIRSVKVKGKCWRKEIVKISANYRATANNSTGFAPAKLIFKNIQTKLSKKDLQSSQNQRQPTQIY